MALVDGAESKDKKLDDGLLKYRRFYWKWLHKIGAKFGMSRRYHHSLNEKE